MSTNCKILIGYTDHMDWWHTEKAYYRHYDGYRRAIIPLLQEFTSSEKGVDITAINNNAEYNSHKFEELNNPYDYGDTNYMYYIDQSNRNEIKCTVLKEDLEFSKKYGTSNLTVAGELIL